MATFRVGQRAKLVFQNDISVKLWGDRRNAEGTIIAIPGKSGAVCQWLADGDNHAFNIEKWSDLAPPHRSRRGRLHRAHQAVGTRADQREREGDGMKITKQMGYAARDALLKIERGEWGGGNFYLLIGDDGWDALDEIGWCRAGLMSYFDSGYPGIYNQHQVATALAMVMAIAGVKA